MKKRLIIVLLLSINIIVIYAKQPLTNVLNLTINTNGEEYSFSQAIAVVENKAYLPMEEFLNNVGYSIYKNGERSLLLMPEKKDVLFNDDIYTSREGNLTNGRKYVFHGTDKHNFNIRNHIEINDMKVNKVYENTIQTKTIQELIEKVQFIYLGGLKPERAGLKVYYDAELHAFLFLEDRYGAIWPGGFSIIVLNCEDGLLTEYSDGGY